MNSKYPATPEGNDPLLPVTWMDNQEVLKTFNITLRTLQRWRKKKLFPCYGTRSRRMYKKSDIEAYLERSKEY